MKKIRKQDLILIFVGLIGSVLKWIDVDPGGWVLYLTFLSFGALRVVDFFGLNPYQRNKTQIIKFIFSLLMIITVITHVIWGGQPLFGLLATLLMLYYITNLEAEENQVPESNS